MRFFLCTGPIIAMTARKPRCILALTSTNPSHHKDFYLWQTEGKYFACRIRKNTKKTCIKSNTVRPGSIVFYDAIVLLGTPGINQTEKELRVVGYRVDNKVYWVATNRYALSAEEIATVYKLRWNI